MSILDQTKYAALGLALALSSAPLAQAATLLGSYQHDYGSLPGRIDPTGNDLLNPASVTISDQSTERFADQFDFSSLEYESITSFVLTLTYAGAGPSFSYQCLPIIGCALVPNEFWTARVQGTNAAAPEDDYYGALSEGPVQTLTLTAADDTGGVSAFAQTLAAQTYAFWMSEWSAGPDEMTLSSAKLEIFGTPVAAAARSLARSAARQRPPAGRRPGRHGPSASSGPRLSASQRRPDRRPRQPGAATCLSAPLASPAALA